MSAAAPPPSVTEFVFSLGSFMPSRKTERLINVRTDKSSKSVAVPIQDLRNYKYIEPNKYHYTAICEDIDDTPDKTEGLDPYYYDHHGLPCPSFAVLTNRGYHVAWPLQYPVRKNGKAAQWCNNIHTSFCYATNGDFACNNSAAIRNPAYKDATTAFFGNFYYELAKLQVDKPNSNIQHHHNHYQDGVYDIGNRNRASFDYVLNLYKAADNPDYDTLLAALENWQSSQIAPALSRPENIGIIKSVLRNGYRYNARTNNRGILRLPPREGFLPPEQFRQRVAAHQAAGAAYARKKLSEHTCAKIDAAVAVLGPGATISAIAAAAGVARKTVARARHFSKSN
jgi:hypothetical protein